MAIEKHEVLIGLAYADNGAVQRALADRDKIRNAYAELNRSGGGFNIQSFGEELRRVVNAAFAGDIRQSPLFQSMRQVDQRSIPKTTTTPTSWGLAQQLELHAAEIARKQVQQRSRIAIGNEGSYKSDADRDIAQANAAKRVERANQAIARAKEQYLARSAKEVADEIRATRREEEARARAATAIQKRTDQESTAARKVEEANQRLATALGRKINAALADADNAEKASQRAASFQTSYPGAQATDGALGAGRVGVNRAEIALEVASSKLATVRASESRTSEQILQAEASVLSASRGLAAARSALAKVEAQQGAQGIAGQFMHGFRGASERPYAEQIGQAFKFSVFYGTAYKLLFAFTATLQQTLQEGIAFQQAVTELKLATESSQESANDLANSLGEQAVAAGFAPSQGVLAGARAVGLYGATQASPGEQERIAEMSARVASRLAFSSGMQMEDVQQNLAAITNAFGGGAAGQIRTYDLDAYMSHRFGVAPGQTIQAVAEAGTVGKAAGFDQEEVNAIAALLMGRTGQTAPAVAGYMAQIFSRGGEGVLGGITQKYGIDQGASLAEQIAELAKVYKTANEGEKTEIASAFGRGKVQNAMVVLLEQFDDVAAAAKGAAADAAGSGDNSFNERLKNIGGQIQLTMGVLKEFANQLGQSGLLHALGLGIVLFRELVEAGTGVLRLWNSLDGPIKAVVAGLLALALATKAGIPGRLASALPSGALAGGGARALGGAALAALANPTTIAIGGLLAIGQLKNTSDALAAAQKSATSALNLDPLGAGASGDDYKSRAAELRLGADSAREGASGLTARLFGKRGGVLEQARQLDSEADRLEHAATLVERAAAQNTSATTSLITGFDAESLSSSLQLIGDSGGSAREKIDALRDAIRGGGDAAERASQQFDPKTFAATASGGVNSTIKDVLSGNIFDASGSEVSSDTIEREIGSALSGTDIEKVLAERAKRYKSLKDLDDEEAQKIAEELAGSIEGPLDTFGLGFLKDKYVQAIKKYLLEQSKGTREIVQGATVLSAPETQAAIASFISEADAVLASLPETDYKGRVATARQKVRNIMLAIRKSSDPGDESYIQLDLAKRALAESQFNELEAMRKAAQQQARGKGEVARIGRSFLRREIGAAIRGRNQDLLATIIGQAGEGAIALARQMLQEAAEAARAAQAIRAKALALKMAAGRAADVVPGTVFEQEDPGGYDALIGSLETSVHSGDGGVYATGSDVPGYEAPGSSEPKETAAERRAALMAANATRSESAIAAAKAEIASARAAMAKAEKGTVEYYNALGQYYSARNALTDAILEYRQNKMMLGIDITDPLAQARVALRAARQKLRSDRGKGDDVLAADRLAVREAETAREATAFQQRLDSVQTAEQLGRISHQKYINYLNNEHDRLEKIKHRTFQQQQQLDQIDGLLKEAASAMDAQWNFGDIKLPTPYQVRRYIEESTPDAKSRAGAYQNEGRPNVATIYIDGADTGAVKRIIDQYVGKSGRVLTTRPRRH